MLSDCHLKKLFFIVAELGLSCCACVSPVAGSGGYSRVAVRGLLVAEASLVVEHRLQGVQASAAEACALRNCGSQAVEQRLSSYGTRA